MMRVEDSGSISLLEVIVINVPAFLFLLLLPVGVSFVFSEHSGMRYTSIVFFIWSISGCTLLLSDYFSRKRQLYMRLVQLNKGRAASKVSPYLNSTLCGMCILRALKIRKKIDRRD